jgi:hypothetical protein
MCNISQRAATLWPDKKIYKNSVSWDFAVLLCDLIILCTQGEEREEKGNVDGHSGYLSCVEGGGGRKILKPILTMRSRAQFYFNPPSTQHKFVKYPKSF